MQCIEIGSEGACVRIARRRILRETSVNDRLDFGGHVRSHAPKGRRLIAEDCSDDAQFRTATEWPARRQHLVKDRSEREDIRARINRTALGLLGRHVRRRAHDEARSRAQRRHSRLSGTGLNELGKSEVENLGTPVARDHDVGRLDIAMNDAACMRRVQSRCDLRTVLERLRNWQRALGKHFVERCALDELHCDEGGAGVLVDVVDGDDVRVIESGGGTRLLDEPTASIGVGRCLGRQHFDRHRSPEPAVDRAVHHAHAAAANLSFDAIVRDCMGH
jgi:hypothetical protein